jgi:hypothetical protein
VVIVQGFQGNFTKPWPRIDLICGSPDATLFHENSANRPFDACIWFSGRLKSMIGLVRLFGPSVQKRYYISLHYSSYTYSLWNYKEDCAHFQDQSSCRFTKREAISDESLVAAIETAGRGLIDADLGGGLIKQRVARPGQGKRGGFRMMIAFRPDRAVFLFGFAKNERDNIEDKELTTLREIVASWFAANDRKIAQALRDGLLIEVKHGKENKSEPSAD